MMAWGFLGVFLFALLLGGGPQTGSWAEAFVQLVSLPLLGVGLWRLQQSDIWRRRPTPFVLLGLIAAIPLLYLIPLPPGIWMAFPGRADVAATYAAAGIDPPNLPLSLDPGATLRGFFSLVPPFAIFIAALQVSNEVRQRATILLLIFAFFSVVLGLAQLAQGPSSGLRPYAVTNASDAVGLFANRNHFAALLYAAIPLAGAWAGWLSSGQKWNRIAGIALAWVVLGSLILGVGISRSRAGVGLGILGLMMTIPLLLPGRTADAGRSRLFVLGVASLIVIAILIAIQFSLMGVLSRFDSELADDLRAEMALTTLQAIWSYLPFGSGFGTFPSIYAMFEALPSLREAYVNHAHNDYLELVLEGGLPALAILVGFLVWLLVRGIGVWRAVSGGVDGRLAKAASISLLLLLLHSFVDYPLRMTTLAGVLALLCALLVAPLRQSVRQKVPAGGS